MTNWQDFILKAEYDGIKVTDLLVVPHGDTASRPTGSTLEDAIVRINNDIGPDPTIEWYYGGSWYRPGTGSINLIDASNNLIGTQGSDTYVVGDQQPYPTFVYQHNVDSFRVDAAAGIRINGTQETILVAFNRFGTGSGDGDPVTVWAAWSYDAGRTWEEAFELVPAEVGVSYEIPQFYYRDSNTLVCLFYKYASSQSWLMGMESTDGGLTWTTPVAKFDFTDINSDGLADPMSNRVLRLSNGTWVLPMGIHIVGTPSGGATGYYDGRLLYSTDGINWVDTNLNITASDNMVGEPGVFEYNETLYYYWRTRSNTIFYVTITDLVTFASASSQEDMHIDAPNSTSTIIYDAQSNRFYALHNTIFKRPMPLEPYPRIYMMLSSSNDLVSWQQVHQVDYKDQQHFFEPTFLKVDDFFLIFYSDGEYFSPDYKHSLKCLRMPLASIQQYRTQQAKLLDIRGYKDWWNDAGLLGRQAKYLHIGNRDIFRGDGYFEINGNPNLNFTSFAPEFDIKTFNTDRGVETVIDTDLDDNAEPFFRTTYTVNGSDPNDTVLLEEHIAAASAVVYKKWATGRWYNKFLDDASSTDKVVLVNNGIVKLGSAPGGGGGGNTIYTADDVITGTRTLDANGNHVIWHDLPYMQVENDGSVTHFLKVTNAATDNKTWGIVNANGTFTITDFTDAGSGVLDFMTLVKGSNEFTVGTRFIKMVANQPYVSFVNTGGGASGLYWGAAAAYLGVSNGSDALIVGDTSGDMGFRVSSNDFLWSTDGGSSAVMKLFSTGALRLHNYGDGTFTGTTTYLAAFDTNGNMIEVDPSSLSGSISEPNTQIVYGTGTGVDSAADFIFNGTDVILNDGGLQFTDTGGSQVKLYTDNGDLLITSTGQTAKFRLLPFGNDIYFDVIDGGGDIIFRNYTSATLLRLNVNGSILMPDYGAGSNTGTLTRLGGFDSSGNLIEVNPNVFEVPLTFSNGLTRSSNTVKLGGTLVNNTSIDATASYDLTITGANTYTEKVYNTGGGYALYAESAGAGVYGVNTGTTGFGVQGDAANANAYGVKAFNTAGTALYAFNTSSAVANFVANPSSTNTAVEVLRLTRSSSGTAASGVGGYISYWLETTQGSTLVEATKLLSKLTTATDGAEVSAFELYLLNGSPTPARKLLLGGAGQLTLDAYGSGTFTGTVSKSLGVTSAGAVVEYDATSGQAAIQFEDEGTNLGTSGTVTEIDFTGAGVTASRAANKVTVNIPGGAGSGITRTVVSTSGSATMGSTASTDYVYFVTGAHTMSLPAASGNTNRYTVKNNHSANITVDTAGAETVEGAASISIIPQGSEDFISDGTNWYVVA